jgi:hypothetical protein
VIEHIESAETHHYQEDNPVSFNQLPRTYMPFALLTVIGPAIVMLIQGDALHPSGPGLVILALLLLGLARRSLVAWSLLLVWNAFMVFVVAAVSGGTWSLPSGPLFVLIALTSVGLLASPSMLQHVGIRRWRSSGPQRDA